MPRNLLGLHHVEQVASAQRGFTDDIAVRVREHSEKLFPSCFTAFDMLVFYEWHPRMRISKVREKEIKGNVGSREAAATAQTISAHARPRRSGCLTYSPAKRDRGFGGWKICSENR